MANLSTRPGNAFDRIAAGSRRFGRAAVAKGGAIVKKTTSAVTNAAKAGGRGLVRHSYNAAARAKEPLMDVAGNEGIRMASHGTGYALDAFIPYRGLRGFLRPSLGYLAVNIGAALLTKGKYRLFFRELAQGSIHHLEATGLRALHLWLAGPGGPHDGMAGTDTSAGPTDF